MTAEGGPGSRWFTERFGLAVPLVSAPMAGISGGRLAAAVSAAGALGTIGTGPSASGEWVEEQSAIARQGDRPFGIGLLGWSLQNNRDPLNAALEAAPALISICFGPYEAEVDAVRGAGIVFATQVGTVEEALAAERCGVDLIVVRGREGGGHGMNEVGTLALLQAVLDAVDRPVLGAGGLSGSGGLAAVLAAGAVAGWAGTAFMACPEAETAAGAKQRLFAASETDTAYGRVFDVAQRLDWPERYGGRALRNAFFDRWVGQYDALAADQAPVEELRSARQAGDFDVAPIYAGQGVGMLREERPAARVVEEFARADEKLRRALDSAS